MTSKGPRIIPFLLAKNRRLVKTIKFEEPSYVGDPANTALMFSDLQVDEIVLLDIEATNFNYGPDIKLLERVNRLCRIPLVYGGGINSVDKALEVIRSGAEKIILNSALETEIGLISDIGAETGKQAVIAGVNLKLDSKNRLRPWFHKTKTFLNYEPSEWALLLEEMGAGELVLTSVDGEGAYSGFHQDVALEISAALSIPVIVNGGISSPEEVSWISRETQCSGVGISSLLLYQGSNRSVMIGLPDGITGARQN